MKLRKSNSGVKIMRIDKFLKVSRIIKRRTVAKELTDNGRAHINGRVAKAGSTVKVGDVITLHFGGKDHNFRVKDLKETTKKEEALEMYEIIGEEEDGK
jgi:ribosomal 50S subunit-recycling heat shock protein